MNLPILVQVTDVFENAPPHFQTSGSITVTENQSFVFDFNASDPDNHPISYSISDGPDQTQFLINPQSGLLTFIQPKDFESPSDHNQDNLYEISITASDGISNVNLPILVQISNKDETPPNLTMIGDLNVSVFLGEPMIDHGVHWVDDQDGSGIIYANSPFLFEHAGTYLRYYQKTDTSGNESLTLIRQIKVLEPNIPIVSFDSYMLTQEGSIHFKAKLLSDGGASPHKYGFQLSKSIDFSLPIELQSSPIIGTQFFETLNIYLKDDSIYYYRPYAVNSAGIGFGSIKKFITKKSDSWYTNLQSLQAGWKSSDWFGSFLPFKNGWIYHQELGWGYVSSDTLDGLWIWLKGNGWLWTKPNVWPFLFRHESANWFYFIKNMNGQPVFYDFNDEGYILNSSTEP